jgi:hypothetical protein
MLRNVRELEQCAIAAADGEIGHVDQLFFDDLSWVIRYLVADAGTWLLSRRVLLSPVAVESLDWRARRLHVALTREQVRYSPDVDAEMPLSRQIEKEYFDYYGWPYYWAGTGVWGFGDNPRAVVAGRIASSEAEAAATAAPAKSYGDPHLRSTDEVTGYHIEAADGEIGHLEDFLFDDETWTMRYLVVDTRNWWPGKRVLLSPQWVTKVSWVDSKVFIDLPREAIRNAPEYDPSTPVDRDYEVRLYGYYSQPTYWERTR